MPEAADDDPVFVLVGKDVEESRPTLLWALRNLRPGKLHFLFFHQPTEMTPSSSGLEQSEIDQILQSEWDSGCESLDKYRLVCRNEGVNEQDIDTLCVSHDVGEGIVELISANDIKKLVIGAADDNRHHEGMVHVTSRIAEYLRQHVPSYCTTWFVCNGNLIQRQGGEFDHDVSSHSSSFKDNSELSWSDQISRQLEPILEAGKKADEAVKMVKEFEVVFKELKEENEEKLQKERVEHEKTKQDRDEARSRYNSELKCRQKVEKELREKNEETEKIDKGAASSSLPQPGSDQPPPYFTCPISREIMRDPVVAADGHTYEAGAIGEWWRRAETSPMTGLRLENQNLVPNLALRSAIEAWLQQHPDFVDSP